MVDTALLNWTLNQVLSLMVIMIRVGPMIFLMPIIGSPNVPTQVKALFTLVVSLILVPVVNMPASAMPETGIGVLVFVLCEVTFGAILSIFTRFIFAATDIAGQMVSVSMGMGMAGVMDPEFGTQVSLVGTLWNIIAILIFLALDGHHIIFRTLVESFTWLQPGSINLSQATFRGMMKGATHMFVLGIQIMAPAAAALFFSHVAMGIIAKTVPQIPIMIVAMPLNIALGLGFIFLSLGYLIPLLTKNFDQYGLALLQLAKGMGG